jgi:hypothetical protein
MYVYRINKYKILQENLFFVVILEGTKKEQDPDP